MSQKRNCGQRERKVSQECVSRVLVLYVAENQMHRAIKSDVVFGQSCVEANEIPVLPFFWILKDLKKREKAAIKISRQNKSIHIISCIPEGTRV